MSILPFLVMKYVSQDKQVLKDPKYQKKYGALYDQLHIKRGFYPLAFNIIFILRRIFVVWILLVLGDFVYIQAGLHILITIWKLFYLRMVRPFKARSDQFLMEFNNFGLLLLYSLVLVIIYYNNDMQLCSLIGWVMIGIVVLWNITNLVIIIVVLCISCCNRKKQKKKKDILSKYIQSGWTKSMRKRRMSKNPK